MSQLRSIPLETADWLLMKVQMYVVAQRHLLNHSLSYGAHYLMDFYKTVGNDNVLAFS